MSRLAGVSSSCILALAIVSIGPAGAESPETFPIPTPEQRAEVRKGHIKIPFEQAFQPLAGPQDNYDAKHYLIELEFVPVTKSVSGSVTMTAQSLVAGFQHVILDFYANPNMSVSSVVRGATPLSFSRVGNTIDVTLDQTFGPGQEFTIKVNYSGVPQSVDDSISWLRTSGGFPGNAVSTLSEPHGARTWWPCKDRPDDKATVEERWTVPSSWIATGNGKLTGTTALPNNRTQYRWQMTDPLTT